MKNAREMFEKLGFNFQEEKETWKSILNEEQTTKHKLVYKCSNGINFKYSWLDVKFNLLKKSVEFNQNSMNYGCCPPPIEMDLLEAINKQCEELEWITREV